MSTDNWAPRGVNPAIPNVARIYDYFLGGKDNFAADRAAAAKIVETAPGVIRRTRENRAFLGRAVRFAAESGVRQFIDIGTGLPTQDNVHQVAQRCITDAHVAYVDNDPVVLTHASALLATDPRTIVIAADMRDPLKILEAATANDFIDLDEPVAVLLVAVLHFLPDFGQTTEIVATFREHMAPGSCLVITHGTAGDMRREDLDEARRIYAKTSTGSLTLRDHEQIKSYFEGLELQEPGLVPVAHWRPEGVTPTTISGAYFLAGVGSKS